ncbi:hypothetical protein ABID96_002195 [Bacillus sp. OAE603]
MVLHIKLTGALVKDQAAMAAFLFTYLVGLLNKKRKKMLGIEYSVKRFFET